MIDLLFSPTPTPSFSFTGDSSSLLPQSSSLEYLNSQLVAHGFVPAPGLCLDGISPSDGERVVKCLFSLLSQRMRDMEETEQLSTKLRTLTYDYERSQSMLRSATDRADNAERDMNVFKSKLAASSKALATANANHKSTTSELIRTRSLLQGVRATHVTELKKRDKQIEKFVNKASKMSEGSGKYLNARIVSGASSSVNNTQSGDLNETALEQAEERGRGLLNENLALKRLVGKTVIEVQAIAHELRTVEEETVEPLTLVSLFPLSSVPIPTVASEKLAELLASLKLRVDDMRIIPLHKKEPVLQPSTEVETQVLKSQLLALQAELDEARKTTSASLQSLLETYQSLPNRQPHILNLTTPSRPHHHPDASFDLLIAPAVDSEKVRLDAMRRDLEADRLKVREAAIKLGNDRASMDKERMQWREEKRRLEVQLMLDELPDTPMASRSKLLSERPPIREVNSPDAMATPERKKKAVQFIAGSRSPRALPQKLIGVGASSPKRSKTAKQKIRSSPKKFRSKPSDNDKGKARAMEVYETEVAIVGGAATTSMAASTDSSGSGRTAPTQKRRKSILTTEFELPPPSPSTSLGIGIDFSNPRPIPKTEEIAKEPGKVATAPLIPVIQVTPERETQPRPDNAESIPSIPPLHSAPKCQSPQISPRKHSVAFPFSKRVINVAKVHKYSPAKPSPLSRILMLGNSPDSDSDLGHDASADISTSGDFKAEDDNVIEAMFPKIEAIPIGTAATTSMSELTTKSVGRKDVQEKVFKAPPKGTGPRRVPVAGGMPKQSAMGIKPVVKPRPMSGAVRKSPVKMTAGRGAQIKTTVKGRALLGSEAKENKGKAAVSVAKKA